ncbi:MAG: hypothetical protein H6624_19175 [Bdellovibrionaceae bacterium]|nr:hypothetical protein [Bdellovibrionales bacterium]MCB9086471.1 hypothetical protein [Pseudobdellovibrionaceae bacterium]
MKSGYDQFFQKAKETAKKEAGPRAPNGKAQQPRRPSAPPTDAEIAIRQALGISQKQSQKRRRRPAKLSSILGMAGVTAGVAVMVWLAFEPWRLDDWFERIEVGFLGNVMASETGQKKPEKSADSKNQKQEKNASSEGREPSSINESVPQDLSYYAKLNDKRQELDLREKELNELEEELHKQKLEIEARIQHLEKLRDQIAGVLKDKVEVDQEKVMRLVEFYSNMKPQQAAKIIGTLNEDLAIEVLGKMKKKSAAEIMNLLEPNKAQVLSEKFAGYKRR